jgi:hypothetical protein
MAQGCDTRRNSIEGLDLGSPRGPPQISGLGWLVVGLRQLNQGRGKH